jgi:hypothetical protein
MHDGVVVPAAAVELLHPVKDPFSWLCRSAFAAMQQARTLLELS